MSATRLIIGGSIAVPASSFAIVRRLYLTTCVQKLAITPREVKDGVSFEAYDSVVTDMAFCRNDGSYSVI